MMEKPVAAPGSVLRKRVPPFPHRRAANRILFLTPGNVNHCCLLGQVLFSELESQHPFQESYK